MRIEIWTRRFVDGVFFFFFFFVFEKRMMNADGREGLRVLDGVRVRIEDETEGVR